MKKALLVLGCIGFLAAFSIVGCGGDKELNAEDFTKSVIAEQFKGDVCDISDLDYKVIQDDGETATVEVEGEIEYKDILSLVKKDGKWMLASAVVKAEEKAAEPVEKAEEKAEH